MGKVETTIKIPAFDINSSYTSPLFQQPFRISLQITQLFVSEVEFQKNQLTFTSNVTFSEHYNQLLYIPFCLVFLHYFLIGDLI